MPAKTQEKLIEEIGNLSVLELADLVNALKEKFGVSEAMSVAQAPAASASSSSSSASAAEEKTEFKVTLKDSGSEKIKVIKALRKVIPNLSLTDAKKMAEEAPNVIKESASKEDAQAMKKELEEAGAKVELS